MGRDASAAVTLPVQCESATLGFMKGIRAASALLGLLVIAAATTMSCGSDDSSAPASAGGSAGADASAGGGGQAGGTSSGGAAGQAGLGAGGSTGGAAGQSGGGANAGGAGGSAGAGEAGVTPPSTGTIDVPGCKGVDGIDQKCSFRYLFDPATCSAGAPCDKLVVFWGGGEMDCSKYDPILEAWSDAGFFATCVILFEDSDGAGMEPYFKESTRVDLSLKAVVEFGKTVWNGKDLMLAGISHGATAPVIAMARTAIDDAAEWKGSRKTAACFFDGAYDVAATDELLGTGDNGGVCTMPLPHARIVGRYYSSAPLLHSCSNNKCACDPDHSPDMDQDTITGVAPSSFAVRQWKLIECGSAMDPCTQDMLPKAPIDALCNSIDSSPDHTCVLDPMPNASHGTCAGPAGAAKCISWFDTLPPG